MIPEQKTALVNKRPIFVLFAWLIYPAGFLIGYLIGAAAFRTWNLRDGWGLVIVVGYVIFIAGPLAFVFSIVALLRKERYCLSAIVPLLGGAFALYVILRGLLQGGLR
jgi:tryptophan-rich sensory protein